MSTDKNLHLSNVLKTHGLELNETLIGNYRTQRDRIKEAVEQRYGNEIYTPLNSGSYAKKTAINTNFDLDLAIPFKKSSSHTLQMIYSNMLSFMEELKRRGTYPITKVSQQRRSINLLLSVGGFELDFDIVPGRELQDGAYEDNFKLNLYDSKAQSHILTNIKAHNELIWGKQLEREVIKLLKVWKTNHKVEIKSFLVELMVLKAFDKDSTMANKALYERLKGSMTFIADNIQTILLLDPANSNNVVTDTLTIAEKALIKSRFARMVEDIEKDESKIETYFPINEEHKTAIDQHPKFRPRPHNNHPNTYA